MTQTTDLYEFDPIQEQAGANLLEHIPAILWDRRWWIIVPILVGAIASAILILVIPPVYRSSALMLVESPQLPDAVLAGSGNEEVQRRIARIGEQVTSRPALLKIIEQHGLYADERRSEPLSEALEQMRKAILIEPQLTGDSNKDAIAFQLSFEYPEPIAAQAVTQDLMDSVLELDYSSNREQAAGTVQFLSDQSSNLEQKIAELQGRISEIKARNGLALSSRGGIIMGNDPASYDMQIAALQRENATLLSQKDIARTSDERSPLVAQAEAELASARAVYSESHPDVVLAKQRLAEAKDLAKQNLSKIPFQGVDQQITSNNAQIATLRAAKQRAEARVNSQLSAQSRAPLVEQQVEDLEQQLSVLNTQYGTVQDQLMAAKTGLRAGDEQMNERLSVVEPPVVPDSPERPNRLLIAALGVAVGAGLGFVLAFGMELLLRPIRDPKTLQFVTGSAPLAVIPKVQAPGGGMGSGLRAFGTGLGGGNS